MKKLIISAIAAVLLSSCSTIKNYQLVEYPAKKITGVVDSTYVTNRWEKQFLWMVVKGKHIHVCTDQYKNGDSVSVNIRKLNQRLWNK